MLSKTRQPSDGAFALTVFRHSDAAVLCGADHDPEHRRRFDCPASFVPSLQHSEDVIARWERERLAGQRFTFAVRNADTGELLGGFEFLPRGPETANLAYWTYPAHRRRGVAVRAVALACNLAVEQFAYRRLEIVIDPDNIGSRRVAAHSGFREVGEREGRILHIMDLANTKPESPRQGGVDAAQPDAAPDGRKAGRG